MAKNEELLTEAILTCILEENFCLSVTDTSPALQQHSRDPNFKMQI